MIWAGNRDEAWHLGLYVQQYKFFGPLAQLWLVTGYDTLEGMGPVAHLKKAWAWIWPWHRRSFYDGLCK